MPLSRIFRRHLHLRPHRGHCTRRRFLFRGRVRRWGCSREFCCRLPAVYTQFGRNISKSLEIGGGVCRAADYVCKEPLVRVRIQAIHKRINHQQRQAGLAKAYYCITEIMYLEPPLFPQNRRTPKIAGRGSTRNVRVP